MAKLPAINQAIKNVAPEPVILQLRVLATLRQAVSFIIPFVSEFQFLISWLYSRRKLLQP
jgi:hypothetical protein